MLFYLYTIITLIPSTFLLFGVSSNVKLNLTIGLVYSSLLFIAFLLRRGQYNFSILYYAIVYWSLLSFVINSISNNNAESIFKPESFLFNLVAASILLALILFFYKTVEELSPFQLLLAGQTLIALCLYFGNLALNYFLFFYFVSSLFLIFSIFVFNKQKSKADYAIISFALLFTYLIFILNELALIYSPSYSFSLLQNYNIFAFLTTLALIGNLLCSILEFETPLLPSPDSSSSNVINQNCNAMWKQSNRGFPSGPRRTSTSLLGWSSFTPAAAASKTLPSISEEIASISPSNKVNSAFMPLTKNPVPTLSNLNELDKQILLEIDRERKASTSGKDLNVNTHIGTPSQSNSFNSPGSTTYFGNHKLVGHTLNLIRSYSTAAAPIENSISETFTLDYPLKAEFESLAYDDDIRSKLEELKPEDLKYTFFKQVNIPVLQGIIGTHHMALVFISDGKHTFLVILTSSKRIPLSDSTFNEKSKEDLPAEPFSKRNEEVPAVQTLYVSDKLLWDRTGVLQAAGAKQYMASTVFSVSKEIVDDLIKLGLEKDPDGQAKLTELYPELKSTLIDAFEKSSFQGEDGLNYLKVASLSKK